MKTIIAAITMLVAFSCQMASADSDVMSKMKSGYHSVPGGQVWFNPGDAYEHSTGLMRDRYGNKRHPQWRHANQYPSQPSVYVRPYATPSPFVNPPLPVTPPTPVPYVRPYAYPQPVYTPPTPYDYGPYVSPYVRPCPRCPNSYDYPSSESFGLGLRGAIDPMDVPKTGDAPLAH